ncbi:MAG: glycosyltransferase [Vicinamibacterales bacterium]
MNLLVVSSWCPYPPDNGSRQRAWNLLRSLTRRHRVTLLAFGGTGPAQDLDGLQSCCAHVEIVPTSTPEGTHMRLRGLLSPVPRHFRQTESAPMRALVAAHLRRHDAAIALQVDAARYLAGCTGLPRVFEEVELGAYRDESLPRAPAFRRMRRRLTRWKYERFVRRLVDAFDGSTVVSDPEREHLLELGCDPDRIAVVPNGADAAAALSSREPVAGRLIYPGPVTYPANLDAVRHFVRDVFPIVRRARPDATFVVTGDMDGVAVGELAAVGGVSFTGRLPDVGPMLATSAACVVPLRIGGGTRLKVLHAMAVGTPVVSTRKGIEGLAIEPGRDALVADNSPAFAAQVLRVLSDPALSGALAMNAHRLVRGRYGWDAIGGALEDALQRAVSTHGRRKDPAHVQR